MEIKNRSQDFEDLKRKFEIAYLNGEDYTELLYELAKAIVFSCINKCVQVGSMHQTEYVILKQQIEMDLFATRPDNGIHVENRPFLDGLDLIQEAACMLLEQAQDRGYAVGWLDKPYSTRIIASRARIKEADTAGYQEQTTTPLQACFRAVRRLIDAQQYTKGSHEFISMDSMDPAQLDALYKDRVEHTAPVQKESAEKWDCEDLIKALKLTERQERILTLRMQGYGYQAIATYLGISKSTVTRTLDRLKDKCKAMGITP